MVIRRANQIDPIHAGAVVIDVQEKLVPLIRDHERVVAGLRKLLDGLRIFGLPVIATEQYPAGLGATVPAVASALRESRATVVEKNAFSAWAEEAVREAILRMDRPQLILVGIETHVCVQQTTLDLISRDYDVFVCADAVGARGQTDHRQGLLRMRQEGAWVTTVESVLFELCQRCDTPQFKEMIEIIKQTPPAD